MKSIVLLRKLIKVNINVNFSVGGI